MIWKNLCIIEQIMYGSVKNIQKICSFLEFFFDKNLGINIHFEMKKVYLIELAKKYERI